MNGYRHWGIEQEENRHNGYFWISYYDHTLNNPEAFVFDKSNVGSSYYVQQYDYVAPDSEKIKEVASDSEMKTANVFMADQNAVLTEISTVTTTPNSEVSYEIYLLRSKYTTPSDGVKIQSGEGYTFEYGGYHRFALKEPVTLFRGQAYSVVISQKTPSGKSVFNIVCDEKHGGDAKYRRKLREEPQKRQYWKKRRKQQRKKRRLRKHPKGPRKKQCRRNQLKGLLKKTRRKPGKILRQKSSWTNGMNL